MSHKEFTCIYDKIHLIPIYDTRGVKEDRNLNIHITDMCDALQIKVRDVSEFSFNYTENVDLSYFEILRCSQHLDINFNEFKTDLIEMLQQNEQKEMFLKCEVTDKLCRLIFYGKSKIKSIIYLTLDLKMTNQREIFNEMNNNLQKIQDSNNRLKRQLTSTERALAEKNEGLQNVIILKRQLKFHFFNSLKQLDVAFNSKVKEIESVLTSNVMMVSERLMKLLREVDLLKKESNLKSDSCGRLIRSMENLRVETIENAELINELKKENCALHAMKENQEKTILELSKNLQENETFKVDLQKKNDELRKDLERSSIVIAKNKQTHDELARDLLQANQMLVNFNSHYDVKVKQMDELQSMLSSKDNVIIKQRGTINQIMMDYEEYKKCFNSDMELKYKHDLVMANNKIQELEQSIRKANKINTLLTEKINTQCNLYNK